MTSHQPDAQAREYLAAGDAESAAKLLTSVSALYRRERWTAPLAASLLEAREAASRLGNVKVQDMRQIATQLATSAENII